MKARALYGIMICTFLVAHKGLDSLGKESVALVVLEVYWLRLGLLLFLFSAFFFIFIFTKELLFLVINCWIVRFKKRKCLEEINLDRGCHSLGIRVFIFGTRVDFFLRAIRLQTRKEREHTSSCSFNLERSSFSFRDWYFVAKVLLMERAAGSSASPNRDAILKVAKDFVIVS
jgi:hypothetical protein